MPGSMTFRTQDEAAPQYDNDPVVYRAEIPDSLPPLQGYPDSTHPQHQFQQPIPAQRPRYSAERLLDLQEDYRGILRSAENMQSAPPAAQGDPAVQRLLQRSRHLHEVMQLVQEQMRTNTEHIQAIVRREQHRLQQRRLHQRRMARRADRLYYRPPSRRESDSSQGTQQHNPMPHLNQPTIFRHDSATGGDSRRVDSAIGRDSRRSIELFTPEQIARIARRQNHGYLRRSASPEFYPRPVRRRSPDLFHAGRLSREQESYRTRRPLQHHHPLSASWPRDRYRPQSSSAPSSPPLWIRRHQPRPAARQGFRSPDIRMSDASSDHAEDEIEQMRHSWPQMPARSTREASHSHGYGVPLSHHPEPAMIHVANHVEEARAAQRREPPPPPSPAHATLYPALSVEQTPPSVVNATLYGEPEPLYEEPEPLSREDAPPPSPFLMQLSSDDDGESHGMPLLSELGVQWEEMRWNAPREAVSSSLSGRSPMHESWDDDLEEGEIRE